MLEKIKNASVHFSILVIDCFALSFVCSMPSIKINCFSCFSVLGFSRSCPSSTYSPFVILFIFATETCELICERMLSIGVKLILLFDMELTVPSLTLDEHRLTGATRVGLPPADNTGIG